MIFTGPCLCICKEGDGVRLPSAARRRAFAICSAWSLIPIGGVKRELWLIRRVCRSSCIETSSVTSRSC